MSYHSCCHRCFESVRELVRVPGQGLVGPTFRMSTGFKFRDMRVFSNSSEMARSTQVQRLLLLWAYRTCVTVADT